MTVPQTCRVCYCRYEPMSFGQSSGHPKIICFILTFHTKLYLIHKWNKSANFVRIFLQRHFSWCWLMSPLGGVSAVPILTAAGRGYVASYGRQTATETRKPFVNIIAKGLKHIENAVQTFAGRSSVGSSRFQTLPYKVNAGVLRWHPYKISQCWICTISRVKCIKCGCVSYRGMRFALVSICRVLIMCVYFLSDKIARPPTEFRPK